MLQLGPLTDLIDVFGPFIIPVALFVCGLLGYLVLVVLSRASVGLGRRQKE